MAKPETEHAEVIALEDAAWNLKDLASDFSGRLSLTGVDRAALTGATRDVNRIYERLRAVRDVRKKRGAPDDGDASDVTEPPAPAAPEQRSLERAEGQQQA